jgi:broad specificity phosphatase PhoE
MTEKKIEESRPIDRAFLTDDPEAGQLILVRHGQQQWPDHETATVGEWIDPPLSALGRQQAEAVARHLAGEPISVVYSSALKRAFDTGAAIAGVQDVEHHVIEQLEEIRLYGDMPADSRPVDVLGEKIVSGARERFVHTRRWDSYPHSETSADFRRRVGYAMEAAIVDHPGETVVVACHGGVINAYLAVILDLEIDMFYRPTHTSVHRIRFKGNRRVVDSLNEQHFLQAQGLLSH